MRPIFKQFICIIDYYSNSDSNNDVEIVDINLFCNKLSIQLLANNPIIHTKKKVYLKQKIKLMNS